MIALVALIAGCGSSTLSPPEVRTQADAICQTACARLAKIPHPGGTDRPRGRS